MKTELINVCVSITKDETRKAAIDRLTMRENCDNFRFLHDELNDVTV